jgi:hypothetical protein
MSASSSDVIANLPVDKSPLTPVEVQYADALFAKQQGIVESVISKSKDVLLVGVLFILFSLPALDTILVKIFPSASSSILLLGLKTLLIMFVYFIIKNIYLVRK